MRINAPTATSTSFAKRYQKVSLYPHYVCLPLASQWSSISPGSKLVLGFGNLLTRSDVDRPYAWFRDHHKSCLQTGNVFAVYVSITAYYWLTKFPHPIRIKLIHPLHYCCRYYPQALFFEQKFHCVAVIVSQQRTSLSAIEHNLCASSKKWRDGSLMKLE